MPACRPWRPPRRGPAATSSRCRRWRRSWRGRARPSGGRWLCGPDGPRWMARFARARCSLKFEGRWARTTDPAPRRPPACRRQRSPYLRPPGERPALAVAGGRHCWQRHHKRQSFLPARFPVGLACCFLWAVTCEVAARYPSAPCSPGTFPLGRAMHMHELPTSRSLVVYVATDSSDGSCLACRAVPPPVVALEELAVELRASAEDAAGLEVTALLAMQHQLAQVWLEPLLISVG